MGAQWENQSQPKVFNFKLNQKLQLIEFRFIIDYKLQVRSDQIHKVEVVRFKITETLKK